MIVVDKSFRVALYKGTRPGVPGIYNRAVRAWERGPYSHCEMIFSDGLAASSSFEDGGVRFKDIQFDTERWDFIGLPADLERSARDWFKDHEGEGYNLMGNVNHIVGFIPGSKGKSFCSEAVAASLGVPEPWRYGPNALASILLYGSIRARFALGAK